VRANRIDRGRDRALLSAEGHGGWHAAGGEPGLTACEVDLLAHCLELRLDRRVIRVQVLHQRMWEGRAQSSESRCRCG
jgi:hypothetical protein